jgi:hypothetical protein
MACKFENVYEWFIDWIERQPDDCLLREIKILATSLDADELQDIYQDEMDADGYFSEEEE